MELYVNLWQLQTFVTEIITDNWIQICDENDDKWHVRKINIKYTIIIIVQYSIEEMVPYVVQLKIKIKIVTYHSLSEYWLQIKQ